MIYYGKIKHFLVFRVNKENAFPTLNFGHELLNYLLNYESFFGLDDFWRSLTLHTLKGLNDRGHHLPDKFSILVLVPSLPNLMMLSEWLKHPFFHPSAQARNSDITLEPTFPSPSTSNPQVQWFLSPKSHLNAYTFLHRLTHQPQSSCHLSPETFKRLLFVSLPQSLSRHSLDNAGWIIFVKAQIQLGHSPFKNSLKDPFATRTIKSHHLLNALPCAKHFAKHFTTFTLSPLPNSHFSKWK